MKAVARADNPGLQEVMPDWVSAALPQRQADIMAEIGRLQAEIETLRGEAGGMESMARLLWQAGPQLEDAVCDTFSAAGFEADQAPPGSAYDVTVNLGDGKRLLVKVASAEKSVTKKSSEMRQVFETAQEVEGDGDRIVLAANVHRERPVADREWLDPVAGDALMILTGLGAVVVTTSALFRIWGMIREQSQAARDHLLRLHAADAGLFLLD